MKARHVFPYSYFSIYNLTRNWNVNEDDLVNDPMGDEIYNLTRNWNVNNVGTTL